MYFKRVVVAFKYCLSKTNIRSGNLLYVNLIEVVKCFFNCVFSYAEAT